MRPTNVSVACEQPVSWRYMLSLGASTSSQLYSLLLPMVRALVLLPDAVRIDVREKDRTVFFTLSVDPSDRGRVLGKQAKTLQALRLLFQAIATIHERNSSIEIKEDDGEPPALATAQARPRDGR